MENKRALMRANTFRAIARYGLLSISILAGSFALISGSEAFGQGFWAVIKNGMNALPWILLVASLGLAWKNDLLGGLLITGLGIALVFFYNSGPNFYITTFILTLAIPVFGLLFIGSWYLRRME